MSVGSSNRSSRNRVGVLLVNLGTPDTADARGIRVYLREFLSDPRVIETPNIFRRALWQTILNGIVLQVRPKKKVKDYLKVWNTEKNESPLKTITRAQAEKLGLSLVENNIVVEWGMRYGNPSLRSALESLMKQGCDRILVVSLYPQYSATTTATVFDKVAQTMGELRAPPTLRYAPPYYEDEAYIDALAASVNETLARLPFTPETVIASFHGMPQSYIDKGDPYAEQCRVTTELLRKKLGRDDKSLMLTFQSRFGFDEWLQPYTDKTVERLAKEGLRRIAVITPGFSADCLETLEEIVGENAEIFKHAGGEHFAAIPCLNDSDAGMDVIRQLVLRELQGWM